MTSRRPSVLMVTGAYFPEMSGAGLQCRELVRQLAGAVDFSVLTTTSDPARPHEEVQDGVPVCRIFVDPRSLPSKIIAAARMAWAVWRRRRAFSIMHLHGFSQKSMLLVALAMLLNKAIAIKLTSVGHDDPRSMRARGRLAYWCYARARVFFGVSPKLESLYAESGLPRERFRLIPNGVDLRRFHPLPPDARRAGRRALGLPEDTLLVLFVGFFSHEKCPDVLFDAWLTATRRVAVSSDLLFIGATRSTYYEVDRRLADDIRARATEAGVSARVHFVEATSTIEAYQQVADVFVLPSLREGLPNALLEAMACGTGCVATRLDGVTDTLIANGESGLLVPPRDVAALASALESLLADPDRARALGGRARQRIERDFSLALAGERYLDVYRELTAA